MLTVNFNIESTNLDKHFIAKRCLGGFSGRAVDGHGLPVTRELQCELFLHQLLNYLVKKSKVTNTISFIFRKPEISEYCIILYNHPL